MDSYARLNYNAQHPALTVQDCERFPALRRAGGATMMKSSKYIQYASNKKLLQDFKVTHAQVTTK